MDQWALPTTPSCSRPEIELAYAEFVGGSTISDEALHGLIVRAESQRLTAKQLVQNKPALDKLTLLLTYHTDAIEGSTMTLADTDAVLFHDTALSNRTFVEQLEAKNHQAALWWLIDELQHKTFAVTEKLVLDLHARLMNGILSDAGQYRRHGVRIAGTRVTVANYVRVPELIQELCELRREDRESLITFMARQHAHFERIHPFSDGNGRIGRLLMLAHAMQHNIVPPIIVRERRSFYYKALETAQLNDDFALLKQLIAEAGVATKEAMFR